MKQSSELLLKTALFIFRLAQTWPDDFAMNKYLFMKSDSSKISIVLYARMQQQKSILYTKC